MDQYAEKSQPSISDLRRERERVELTERIMDAAREMFVCNGYEAVTLRRIALAIEYSPAAIYQYFRDKKALVQAIIRKDSEDLRQHLMECLTLKDPVEQVVEMARRYVNWGASHPNHYRLMLMSPPEWSETDRVLREQAKGYLPLEQEVLSVLYLAVQEAMRRGRLRSKYSDPALVAATLWAGVHGVVLLEIGMTAKNRASMGGKDTSFEARFDTLKEVFLDGFLTDGRNADAPGGKRKSVARSIPRRRGK